MRSVRSQTAGFSLLELLVVVSIIAILVALTAFGLRESQAQARDAKRQADLQVISSALELYKNKYGRYPEACRGASNGSSPTWSGERGTGSYECSGDNEYITGLAPEFIPTLPRDPRAGASGDSGYVYAVNNDGSVYKFMAWNSVESEELTNTGGHPFFRCGELYDQSNVQYLIDGNSDSFDDTDICERSPTTANGSAVSPYNECTNASQYRSTYAISAGFSTQDTRTDNRIEFYTERLRCR